MFFMALPTIKKKGLVEVEFQGKEKKNQNLNAEHIIIATGASPVVLPQLQVDKKNILTYFEAMVPEDIPDELLVVGSGAIGMEFACFLPNYGS